MSEEKKDEFSLAKKLLGRINVNRAPEGPTPAVPQRPPGAGAGPAPAAAGHAPTARHQPGGQPRMILNELLTAMKQWEKAEGPKEPEGYELIEDDRPGKQLRKGFEGRAVEALQRALKQAGYDCPQTGVFDDRTDLVVRKFQRENGCDEKGIIGPRTLVALDRKLGLPPRRRGPITAQEAAALREKKGDEEEDLSAEGLPTTGNGFIDGLAPGAVRGMRRTGVPASVSIAIAALESGWGTSALVKDFKNPYNVYQDDNGNALRPAGRTPEGPRRPAGDNVPRRYPSEAAAAEEFAMLFVAVPEYKRLLASAHVPERFAQELTGVYSPQENYGQTLVRIMKQYDLVRFDMVAGRSES